MYVHENLSPLNKRWMVRFLEPSQVRYSRTRNNQPTHLHQRKRAEGGDGDGGGDAADKEERVQPTSTSTIVSTSAVAAALSPATVAAASSSSGTLAVALPSAPAATAAGGLFSAVDPALDGDILRVLSLDFGFTRMTPVQQQCRKDVAVRSRSAVPSCRRRQGCSLYFICLCLFVRQYNVKIITTDGEVRELEEEERSIPLSTPERAVSQQPMHAEVKRNPLSAAGAGNPSSQRAMLSLKAFTSKQLLVGEAAEEDEDGEADSSDRRTTTTRGGGRRTG